ncbi:claudin-34 [Discoglossus pictus]
MPYLAKTVNLQLFGFALSTVGWILGSISTGLVQWRVWHVANNTIITSGIAWIGIWRTCFFSQTLVSTNQKIMYCQEFSVTDSFVPREIFVAQGLMLVAIIVGAAGKASCVVGLKNIYQGCSSLSLITQWFTASGILHLFASSCIIISVAWNLHSVANNNSISFPSTYFMPTDPDSQEVGAALSIGIISAILQFLSGTFFLFYKLPKHINSKVQPYPSDNTLFADGYSIGSLDRSHSMSVGSLSSFANPVLNCDGITNEAFEIDEKL